MSTTLRFVLYRGFLLSLSAAPQLSRHAPECAGLLCDKAVVLGDKIKTTCMMFIDALSHSTGKLYKLQIFKFEFLTMMKIRTLALWILIVCNWTGIQEYFVEICSLYLEVGRACFFGTLIVMYPTSMLSYVKRPKFKLCTCNSLFHKGLRDLYESV